MGRQIGPSTKADHTVRHNKGKEQGHLQFCAKTLHVLEIKLHIWTFPGGSGVKNPSADAGDMGSIPDTGRFHTLWSN